jgi:hypothetical protein
MNDPTRLLLVAYWFGAILDGAMVVPLLVPRIAAAMLGLVGFAPTPDFRYAAAVGAALMAGWTALLVWGALRPLDRRGILLLTACPVVVGLIAAGIYAVASGLVRLPLMVPMFAFQVGGCALFVTAYLRGSAFARGATLPEASEM